MYKIISGISFFLRTFLFPNPFAKIINLYLADTMLNSSAPSLAELFNFSVGGIILCTICYPLVGIVYDKRKAPVLGSFLYCIFVLLNSWILSWISCRLGYADICSLSIRFGIVWITEGIILLFIRVKVLRY